MRTAFYSLLIFTCAFVSCKNVEKGKYSSIDSTLALVMPDKDLSSEKYCIIIPKSGCTGCIASATYFVKNNIDKIGNAQVIFTGIEDLKLLKIQLGANFLKKSNVIIDEQSLFRGNKVFSDYPQLVYLENGFVSKVVELNTADPELLKGLGNKKI